VQLSYIKDLSKAYVIDHRLFEGANIITEDELTENFYNAIKTIRSDHPNLYESFIDSNVYDQQRIFKMYFDLSFETYTEIDVDKVFLELDLDNIEQIDRDSLENLEEGKVLAGIGAGLVAALAHILFVGMGIISVGWLPSAAAVGLLVTLLFPTARRNLSKGSVKIAYSILNWFGKAGKVISEAGDEWRLAFSIIHNNAQKCMQKCEYDPAKKSGPAHYLYQLKQGATLRDIGRSVMSIDTEDKLDCMRTCYLETLKESVKLIASVYFQCLRNTGDMSKLPLEKDFSTYQKIIVKTQLNQTCNNFMDQFSDALNNYNLAVNMIYAEDKNEQQKQRYDLMSDIYNLQKQSTDSRPSQSSQKPSYNNQKPSSYNNRRQQ